MAQFGIQTSANTYDGILLGQNAKSITTGCEFNGQLIMGGFDTSNFWPAAWQTLLSNATSLMPSAMKDYDDIGTAWVWWSSPGGGDVGMFLNGPDLVSMDAETWHTDIDGYTAAIPYYLDLFRRNTLGWMPMPWQGAVSRVLPLGNSVIVYGEQGIGAIDPISSPIRTFGYRSILDFGIKGRSSAGGDRFQHCFVTVDGTVWTMGPDLVPQEQGYESVIDSNLTSGSEIVITLDPKEREFHIADSEASFQLTRNGLGGRMQKLPTTLHRSKAGGLVSINDVPSSAIDTVSVTTDTFDFGTRKTKIVHRIEAAGMIGGRAVLQYRTGSADSFTDFPNATGTLLDTKGTVEFQIAGVEFRLKLTAAAFPGEELDYVDVFSNAGVIRANLRELTGN